MMMPKYIEGDIVKYDDKIMVIKEPRDGSHFDLFCPQEGLVYCLVDVEEIKSVNLTPAILEKNGWEREEEYGMVFSLTEVFMGGDEEDGDNYTCFELFYDDDGWFIDMRGEALKCGIFFVHELQHLFFGLGIKNEIKV